MKAVRANQTADDMVDEGVVDFLGVSRSDGRCLDIVDRLGRVTAGRLAAESGLSTGAVTALVDRMEAAGYLRRRHDKNDRRKVWIEGTEEIAALTELLFGHLEGLARPLLDRFTPTELGAITDFLELSTYINRQRAALLQDHLVSRTADGDERMTEARAFDRDARRLADAIGKLMQSGRMPGDFADPDAGED